MRRGSRSAALPVCFEEALFVLFDLRPPGRGRRVLLGAAAPRSTPFHPPPATPLALVSTLRATATAFAKPSPCPQRAAPLPSIWRGERDAACRAERLRERASGSYPCVLGLPARGLGARRRKGGRAAQGGALGRVAQRRKGARRPLPEARHPLPKPGARGAQGQRGTQCALLEALLPSPRRRRRRKAAV